jgi:hypothetical protein
MKTFNTIADYKVALNELLSELDTNRKKLHLLRGEIADFKYIIEHLEESFKSGRHGHHIAWYMGERYTRRELLQLKAELDYATLKYNHLKK